MWQPQIDELKSSYQCITYDLNGFGKSEVPPDNYDPVLTLKELLDTLKINKVSIVALSLGTHIAIHFMLAYQSLVDKSVLMSCTIPGANFSQKFLKDWSAVEKAGNSGDFSLAKKLWLNCQAFSQLSKNNHKNFRLFKQIVEDYCCWDIYHPPKKLSRPDAISRLKEIIVPTLVISGGKDYPDFLNNGNLLENTLPHSLAKIIPSSSHMVNLEFPDIVNKLISDFLKK
jgi:pimeloyl-ACP methyl ester carboxylesterase